MVDIKTLSAYHTSDAAKRFMRRRHASESRFKFFGAFAILLAVSALATLAYTIGSKATGALIEYDVVFDVSYPDDSFDLESLIGVGERALIERGILSRETTERTKIRAEIEKFMVDGFIDALGGIPEADRKAARDLLSNGNIDRLFVDLDENVSANAGRSTPGYVGILSDEGQMYYKGAFGRLEFTDTRGELTPVFGADGSVELFDDSNDFRDAVQVVKAELSRQADILTASARRQENAFATFQGRIDAGGLSDQELREATTARDRAARERDNLAAQADDLRRRADLPSGPQELGDDLPSILVFINGGVVKLETIDNERATGFLLRPLESDGPAARGEWRLAVFETPQENRKLKDNQIVWLEQLRDEGRIESNPNLSFLSNGDSREPELAGMWAALVGSFWTMLVTFALAFPLGVMAAIYLEEFAPKNWLTDMIEVNINNLAAIPSIVFGLFGLMILLSGFELPILGGVTFGGWFAGYTSAAFVGGIVLALMTLPTIIIASRASVRAVPPSIRSAALGVGASNVQTVAHHVLPLAMPGIMTGTIIGLAQALGETAPLIMVGMIGFFVEPALGLTDPTTVMPALIYSWSDKPEPMFELKTSLAIVVLLLFLVVMNAIAVFLRKRFERRW